MQKLDNLAHFALGALHACHIFKGYRVGHARGFVELACHAVYRFHKVGVLHRFLAFSRCMKRCFVANIGDVGARQSGCHTCQFV